MVARGVTSLPVPAVPRSVPPSRTVSAPYPLPEAMSSPTRSTPALIDRREALRRTSLLLGGIISAPTVAALLSGCDAPAPAAGWTPRALSATEAAQVATIVGHIIPTTDTPGAREAGVDRFIDRMLAEYYSTDNRAAFLRGLADVDRRAHAVKGTAFLDLDPGEQRDLLTALDAEAYRRETVSTAPGQPPFMRAMKELTLLGYYTSQAGATQELRYARVPGRFDGCVAFENIGRSWAT